MNLKTPLPLPAVATNEPPAPGDPVPDEPSGFGGGSFVVAFLRHPGCPFAEQTLRSLRVAAAARPEVEWLAISHASREKTDEWVAAVGGSEGVELIVDEDRRLYAAWGIGRTALRHFTGIRSLGAVATLARAGIRNREPDGSRWQGAGTFAVESAIVRWRHLPAHAGDLPDLDRAGRAALG